MSTDQKIAVITGARMGTVDDVADAAEYLVSELAAWVSGQSLLVSGGALQ